MQDLYGNQDNLYGNQDKHEIVSIWMTHMTPGLAPHSFRTPSYVTRVPSPPPTNPHVWNTALHNIPKRLHILSDPDAPSPTTWPSTWTSTHPTWAVNSLPDEISIRNVVYEAFPEWVAVYEALNSSIGRVHLAKYLLLLTFGGCVTLSSVQAVTPIDVLVAP